MGLVIYDVSVSSRPKNEAEVGVRAYGGQYIVNIAKLGLPLHCIAVHNYNVRKINTSKGM